LIHRLSAPDKHHIITWKLTSHFPAALLPSGHRNAIAIVELHRHHLGLPPFYLL
jgi:hypothetical protein